MAECNNTSVGVLVERDNKILLIERKNFPFGWAPPAGHVEDNETYEQAAKRELKEEVGLDASELELLIEGRKEYSCARGGTWHYWKLFKADVLGITVFDKEEAKNGGWFTYEDIKTMTLDPVIGVLFAELGII